MVVFWTFRFLYGLRDNVHFVYKIWMSVKLEYREYLKKILMINFSLLMHACLNKDNYRCHLRSINYMSWDPYILFLSWLLPVSFTHYSIHYYLQSKSIFQSNSFSRYYSFVRNQRESSSVRSLETGSQFWLSFSKLVFKKNEYNSNFLKLIAYYVICRQNKVTQSLFVFFQFKYNVA